MGHNNYQHVQIKPVYFARVIYGIILIIVVSLVAIVSNDSSLEETLFRPNAPISSIEERLKLWTKTLNMISENPLLGVGIGNWKIIIPSYGTTGLRSEQGEVHFQRPHNDFLWILAETGIISLLFYTGFFVIIAIYAKATLADLSASDEVKIFSLLNRKNCPQICQLPLFRNLLILSKRRLYQLVSFLWLGNLQKITP